MPIAHVPSGEKPPSARRPYALLAMGVALAIWPATARAQDAYLRGSLPDAMLSAPDALPGASADDLAVDTDSLAADAPTQAEPPLRALERPEFAREMLRIGAISSEDDYTGRMQRENMRQSPEQGIGPAPEVDPFAPIGIRAGTFVLRPTLEQGLRATTNGNNSPGGSGAVLSETALRLNARSDWSRHQATLDAAGAWNKSIAGENVSEPWLDIQGRLRLDLAEQTAVNAGAGYRLARESASSPNGVVGALERPLVQSFNASLGVERDLGLVFGRATALVERDLYGNAELVSGGTVSQKDRDNTYAGIALRGGFSLSPVLKPFVETEFGKRIFDERVDSNGYERSGSQFALRGGLMVDMGEKLNGEFAAGYMSANSDDPRLADVDGPSINATLNWSPLRGTDMRLFAQTTVDTSTTPGVAGSLLYYASLNLTHRIRSDLSVNGQIDATIRDNRDGTGTDYTLGTQIGATYWINRFVGLDARMRYQFLTSQIASREYQSSSIYLGMKLQR